VSLKVLVAFDDGIFIDKHGETFEVSPCGKVQSAERGDVILSLEAVPSEVAYSTLCA
jgi:hypothetical protein